MPSSAREPENAAPEGMADFFYSPDARQDLLEIWEFIAERDLDAADRVEKEIEKAVKKLAVNPRLGHLRLDLTSKAVRFWPVYSYLIVYDPEARPLEVVRVLSGYRDIAALLS
jgi:plasmid stabilization system protein ParE